MRLFEQYRDQPPKLQFQTRQPPRTPRARKEGASTDSSSTLIRTHKLGIPVSSHPNLIHLGSHFGEGRPEGSVSSFNFNKPPMRPAGTSPNLQERNPMETRGYKDDRWRDIKLESSIHKSSDESTFMTKQISRGESLARLEALDLRHQLDNACKRIYELQQKNTLLESLIQNSELEISKFNSSQVSSPFMESFAEGEKILQGLRIGQRRNKTPESKSKDEFRLQFQHQDDRMKEKDSKIRQLTERINEGRRQYQFLESSLCDHKKNIRAMDSGSSKILDHADRSRMLQTLSKKDLQVSVLKSELTLARDLLSKREEAARNKESFLVDKLHAETKILIEDGSIKDKDLAKERETVSRLEASIYAMKEKLTDLNLEALKKAESLTREKDHSLQQVASLQESVRTLQSQIEKGNSHERFLEEIRLKLTDTISEEQEIVKKLRDENQSFRDQASREQSLVKDKESYQRLLMSQETSIRLLKGEVQTLMDQISELRKKAAREANLLSEKDNLNKLVLDKNATIAQLNSVLIILKEKVAILQKQGGKEAQLISEGQLQLRRILEQQNIIQQLREQNTQLQNSDLKVQMLCHEKEGILKSLALKDQQVKSAVDNSNRLLIQLEKCKEITLQREELEQLNKSEKAKISKLEGLLQVSAEKLEAVDVEKRNQEQLARSLKQTINSIKSQGCRFEHTMSQLRQQHQAAILEAQIITQQLHKVTQQRDQLLKQRSFSAVRLTRLEAEQQTSQRELSFQREQQHKQQLSTSRHSVNRDNKSEKTEQQLNQEISRQNEVISRLEEGLNALKIELQNNGLQSRIQELELMLEESNRRLLGCSLGSLSKRLQETLAI